MVTRISVTRISVVVLAVLSLVASVQMGTAAERISKIPMRDFQRLHSMMKPQFGESPWREVSWLTNITEARRRALAEDKPLVIFTAADGSPLCRT